MAIKGLAQAMKNLDAIDRRAVPRACRHDTEPCGGVHHRENGLFGCQELAVPRRLIRERIRLQRASADRVYAKVIINTGNLPAIKLGTASVRLSRRKRTKERRACGHERRWQCADCGEKTDPGRLYHPAG